MLTNLLPSEFADGGGQVASLSFSLVVTGIPQLQVEDHPARVNAASQSYRVTNRRRFASLIRSDSGESAPGQVNYL